MHRLYDFAGHGVSLRDTEDKQVWCEHGLNREQTFVHKYGKQTKTRINPAKETNEYAPDLLFQGNKREHLADLKTQNTPFFTAENYDVDPQFAVTINVKDIERYSRKYPGICLFWWVRWQVAAMESNSLGRIEVTAMEGVWARSLPRLLPLCIDDKIHRYQKRIDDKKGNATASYVLDLRDLDQQVFVQRPHQ